MSLLSASVSPCNKSEVPSETVKVASSFTAPVSLSATGESLAPVVVIVNVAVSVSSPSETV